MIRHIFLTGAKQIGKSTLIRKALEKYSGKLGGFLTVRTKKLLKDRYSVHMLHPNGDVEPDESNLLFVCSKADGRISERFDRLGCNALMKCYDSDLIIMDELGPHEADASMFRSSVLKQLDKNIPIIGVLQAPASKFWNEVIEHPHTRVIEVSEKNRNEEELLSQILSIIKSSPS